jgi:translocator protein
LNVVPTVIPIAQTARTAAVAILATLLVAVAGQLVTDLGPWYAGLRQPPWKPPDMWFGPAWSLIFALVATAATRAWLYAPDGQARRRILVAFASNAVLNVLWSWLFFHLRRPDWAFAEVVLLWASIAAMIAVAWRQDRLSGWLLLPYLLWVTFAAALNLAVVRLNGPF